MFKSVTALKLSGYRTGRDRHTDTRTQPFIVKDETQSTLPGAFPYGGHSPLDISKKCDGTQTEHTRNPTFIYLLIYCNKCSVHSKNRGQSKLCSTDAISPNYQLWRDSSVRGKTVLYQSVKEIECKYMK